MGVVVDITPDHAAACARHEKLMEVLDAKAGKERPGVLLLFSFVCDAMLLHRAAVTLASGVAARCYRSGQKPMVEFTDKQGWRDRRHLPTRTLALIHANGGCAVSLRDRQRAVRLYRELVPEARGEDPWSAMLSDAASWWSGRATRDEFDHALRARRLHALPQSALARRASGLPLRAGAQEETFAPPPERPTPPAHVRSDQDARVLKALLRDIACVARDKQGRAKGRALVVAHIDVAQALVQGADAFHLLAGLRLAVTEGGLRGAKLAPRTLASYAGAALMRLYTHLAGMAALDWAAEQAHERYTVMIDAAPKSVRKNLAIFLTTFHRYLVVVGAEPLLKPLYAGVAVYPPDASVVWPHEIALALQYVDARAPTPQIRLQARLILILGAHVPMRPEEFWNLLFEDVHDDGKLTLRVWPRVADGGPKALATRRSEDLTDRGVAAAVLALYELRREQGARHGERLMGDRRSADGCHAVRATEKLVKEALVWATGYRLCSIYQLRHTAISAADRRIRAAQPADRTSTDSVPHLLLQARTGHACRRSVENYLHQFEEDFEASGRHWCPTAWADDAASRVALASLPAVEQGLVAERPAAPEGLFALPAANAALLSTDTRRRIVRDVLEGHRFDAIAALEYCEVSAVRGVVKQVVTCAAAARLISPNYQRTDEGRCLALERLATWEMAAGAAKLAPVALALDAIAHNGSTATQWELFFNWTQCVSGPSVSLLEGNSARRLVEFLRDEARIPSHQLFFLAAPSRHALPVELEPLNLQKVPMDPRRGRKPFRLVLLPRGMRWDESGSRHQSMVGLHWHFLLLGSALMSQE